MQSISSGAILTSKLVSVSLDVAQGKDSSGHKSQIRVRGDDGVQALGCPGEVADLTGVAKQIHAKVVKSEVGDGDSRADVF
ncbi:hypothetical protein, partial [Escherichia coli]|uniref:hypothetical protein n=1 Tax=Escherichia coli TaxID=562 RepID=UPI00312C7EB4